MSSFSDLHWQYHHDKVETTPPHSSIVTHHDQETLQSVLYIGYRHDAALCDQIHPVADTMHRVVYSSGTLNSLHDKRTA